MTEHPDVERARRGYEAFAKGDLAVTVVGDVRHRDLDRLAPAGGGQRGQHHGVLVVAKTCFEPSHRPETRKQSASRHLLLSLIE